MTQQWDGTNKNSNITVTGTPALTASSSLSGNWASGAASESFLTGSGRYWFIATLTYGSDNRMGVGITSQSASFVTGNFVGTDGYGLIYRGDGFAISSGGSVGTLATFASGTAVGVALDEISNKVWFQPGAGANWNNDVIGNQNPAVGSQVGGIAIPSAMLNDTGTNLGLIRPAYTLVNTDNTAVAQFAQASWDRSAPTGFGPFDPVVPFTRWPQMAPLLAQ